MYRNTHLAIAVASVGLFAAASQGAVIRYWASTSTSTWNNTANWDDASNGSTPPATVPNGTSDAARFNQTGSDRTTTLDVPVVLGELSVTNRKAWTINDDGNGRTITFRTDSGNAIIASSSSSNQGNDQLVINPAVVLDLSGKTLAITQADRDDGANRSTAIKFNGAITGDGNISISNANFVGDLNEDARTTLASVNSTGSISVTGGGGIYLNGTLGGNVTSLTKGGGGLLLVNGVNNAHTGGTTVNAGTLRVMKDLGLGTGDVDVNAGILELTGGTSHNYINDLADLSLDSTGVLFANFTGTDTIGQLLFDGVPQALGTWGRVGHATAQHTTSKITGEGVLLVTVPEPASISLLGLAGLLLRRRR